MHWTAWLLLLVAAVAQAAPDSSPQTALADYVAEPDDSFAWRVHARYREPGAEIIELHLDSQTWRDVLWKHQLYLIRPEGIDPGVRQGLIVVGGGRWRNRYEAEVADELPDDAALFVEIARQLDTVVAVLGQVPFQPLFGMTEDELIAHTFVQYLETGDSDWPLLLPMVKSVVRAMDATQALAADEWGLALQRFTVLGGSKRGWTTWLTGAVEPRVAALFPAVIDVLNFAAHMPYQTTVWGAPSDAVAPYTRRGLFEILGSERGRALRQIVDPYAYRERFTQAKVVVVATKDAYFPLDAMNLYWDDLPEPKYALYLPNDGHSIEDFGRLIPALKALHDSSSSSGRPLPDLAWEFEQRRGALRLCVRAEPVPEAVVAWTAESADADFRDADFAGQPVIPRDGVFVFDLGWPAMGFRAVFAETVFGKGESRRAFSTNVRVAGPGGEPVSELTAIRGTSGVCP